VIARMREELPSWTEPLYQGDEERSKMLTPLYFQSKQRTDTSATTRFRSRTTRSSM
jgi:hypothetical protein